MKTIKYLLKMFMAGLLALVILCGFSCIYCLSPMRVENKWNNTDYVWESKRPWMKMTEGVSYGITDANGFNNIDVVENPDIILLGSSHMEGMNVQQKDQVVSLLNDAFEGDFTAYNMGVSGHTFFKVVQYLEKSVSLFDETPEYVIIETSTTNLSQNDVDAALNAEVEKTSVNSDGIVAMLQRLPFLRQVYHQLDSGMKDMLLPEPKEQKNQELDPAVEIASDKANTEEIVAKPYEDMFAYLKSVEEKYGTQIIIVYHPFEQLNEDGSISFSGTEYTKTFLQYAQQKEIAFIDMTDAFEKMYYEDHKVAHGFATGEIGSGHINKYAHKAMAQSLYEYILQAEEDI